MTITVDQIKATTGVASVTNWESGDKVRHYINFADARSNFRGDRAVKVWLDEADNKLHVRLGKGTMSTEVIHAIESLIGCNLTNRYSQAPDYVVIEG